MSENSNDNKENRNLKKRLKALNLPYKRSKAYEAFGDVKSSNNESSVFWNSKVDYVVKYENAKIDNPQTKDMEENEDKNIPLMEPTFFASDDPNNPKYVSLEEKKKNLELKKIQKRKMEENSTIKILLTFLPSFVVGLSILISFIIKYDFTLNGIMLITALSGGVMLTPPITVLSKCTKKSKQMIKEINDLEKEIEEEIKIKKQEKKSSIKEKVKSLSEETKKVLNDVSKDEELKETRKAFGMSYEEFLELYEKTNGFQDDIEIDKAIEALDIFDEKNNSSENSSTQRKRYKITGRKKL